MGKKEKRGKLPPIRNGPKNAKQWKIGSLFFESDAAFLLTVGSFLLTAELFYLQLTILAFLLTVGALLLTVLAFLLTVGAFCLEWESASNKDLKGL